MKPIRIYLLLAAVIFICHIQELHAQQDPQYSQYMYNTMTTNAAYTGSRGHLSAISLYRNQWVGIEGAPRTLTFGLDTPVGLFDGVGLSIIHDELGPSTETYFDGNYAHSLVLNRKGHRLSFGLKAGVRFFSLDWSRGRFREPEAIFNENVTSKLFPTVGAGMFYFSDKAYFGVSTPSFFMGDHFDDAIESQATEAFHLYIIGGYVFEMGRNLKFKPSFFVKQVQGAPLAIDTSANFLMYNVLTLGTNYRWQDSLSAYFGFRLSSKLDIGYAYDYNITELSQYNVGTHEVFVRFQLITNEKKLKSPRFF